MNYFRYKINSKYFLYSFQDGTIPVDDNSIILPSNNNLIQNKNVINNNNFLSTKAPKFLQNDKDIQEIMSNNKAGVITQNPPNTNLRKKIIEYGNIKPGEIDYRSQK